MTRSKRRRSGKSARGRALATGMIAALAAEGVAGGVAQGAQRSVGAAPATAIYACYSDTTDVLSYLKPGATCPTGSTKISWNHHGTRGAQGKPGAQGAQGATGLRGAQGAQGSQGAAGPQGLQGPAGARGVQGVRGAKGSQGTAGTQQGPQGSPGPLGATGAQGAQGATGPRGGSGAQGAGGAQGSPGPQGAPGNTGYPGPQGKAGAIDAWNTLNFNGVATVVNVNKAVNNPIASLHVDSGSGDYLVTGGGNLKMPAGAISGNCLLQAVDGAPPIIISSTEATQTAGSVHPEEIPVQATGVLQVEGKSGYFRLHCDVNGASGSMQGWELTAVRVGSRQGSETNFLRGRGIRNAFRRQRLRSQQR